MHETEILLEEMKKKLAAAEEELDRVRSAAKFLAVTMIFIILTQVAIMFVKLFN